MVHRSWLRLGIFCLLGTLLRPAAAQETPTRSPARPAVRPVDFVTGQDDNLFSLKRSEEDIHAWSQALAEIDNGQLPAAVERLYRLLRTERGDVVPIAAGRFYGLRLAVVQTLARLPDAGKAAYDNLVRREAGALAERPLVALEPEQLLLLAQRFPAASRGQAARLRLGDLALERGDALTASDHFRQALDGAAPGSAEERSIDTRLAAARVLLQPASARAAAAAKRLPEPGQDLLAVLPAGNDPTGYPAFGGGGDGRLPMAAPAGQPELLFSEAIQAPGFDGSGSFSLHATGDLDGIYVHTGRQLVAFDILRQGVAWESAMPYREQATGRRSDDDQSQINQDGVLAAAYGGDVVVAALQVPDPSRNVDFHNGYRIISKLPMRRLFAWSRSTGKLLWSHFDEIEGPRTRRFHGHDACGPPLVAGDTVYIPVHDRSGAIAFSVAAYDLHSGSLRWRRLVCSSQQEVNMFGNARAEFAASPLTLSDGVLFGAANLGVVYAIERDGGAVRWISAHEVVRMPATRFHSQQSRPVYFANNAPIVLDGVLCTTPLDSPYVLGFAAETGSLVWRIPAEAQIGDTINDLRWLAGAIDNEFLLAGRGVVAVRARPTEDHAGAAELRQLVRPEQLRERGEPATGGRPAVTADHIYVPRPGRILGFDRAGNALPPAQQMPAGRFLPGNLLFVDGAVVALRQRALDVFVDAAALAARVTQRVEQAPDDPAALLRLATLRLAMLPNEASAAAREPVRALFRRGLLAAVEAGLSPQHPVRQALQRELYEQAIAAAKAGDANAEASLAEAREVAPDDRSWLLAQMQLLERLADRPQLLRQELERLQQAALGPTVPLTDDSQVPLRAFVLWRLAALPDEQPARSVLLWQELLEQFPAVRFAGYTAAELASAAIAATIARHGAAVYAPIAERAAQELAKAGEDIEALGRISTLFPNSPAAATAQRRRLDLAVAAGDLATAAMVLAQAASSGAIPPSLLRRVGVAAEQRGNRPLAAAMLRLLQAQPNQRSDWPADGGSSYGDLVPGLLAALAVSSSAAPLLPPAQEILRIPVRSGREVLQLRPVLRGDGFARRADEPLYAVANGSGGSELLAFDTAGNAAAKPLFRWPVQFLEFVVICDDLLLVVDLERLVAIDYRSGELRWELPGLQGRLLDCLGLHSGVLHVCAQDDDGRGAELLGVEPLTGVVLFSRMLRDERWKPVPKPSGEQLLWMASRPDGGAVIHRLHAATGQTVASVPVRRELLQQDSGRGVEAIAARIFPQSLCATDELVFLPIDSNTAGDAPEVVALANDGRIAFRWRGRTGSRLAMVALHGQRLVLVEAGDQAAGQFTLLDGRSGQPIAQAPLGQQIQLLNWQRGWLANPAPAQLVLTDAGPGNQRERRLLCLGIAPGRPSFEEPLANDDGEVERQPLVDEDLLVYGVRSQRGGSFRLHALRLSDRSGALPEGAKYLRLRLGGTQGMQAHGPHTVLATADALLLYGPRRLPR